MNSTLAQTIIATFRDDEPDVHRARLEVFDAGDWKNTFHWLDVSGLALYFSQRLKTLSIEDAVPIFLIKSLDRRLADNRQRTAVLFNELVRINKLFARASLRYANLKGFTLVPSYCPDPALRYQIDLDFLMSPEDAESCRQTLNGAGYVLTGSGDGVMEFTAGLERVPSVRDLYKPKPQRSLEVHFTSSPIFSSIGLADCLHRLDTMTSNGLAIPALTPEDMFLAQALHLSRHIRSEWTRTSWALEYKKFVTDRRKDTAFWLSVRACAEPRFEARLAVGMATWLAEKAFGRFAPRDLAEWSVSSLPSSVCQWLENYGQSALLTNFPGTKLYLLLENELAGNCPRWREARRKKLLPFHLPYPVVTSSPNIRARVSSIVAQLQFGVVRLRFHLLEGLRYLWEGWRWKRSIYQGRYPPAEPEGSPNGLASRHQAAPKVT